MPYDPSNPAAASVLGQIKHWLWTLERELDRLEEVRHKGLQIMSDDFKRGQGRYTLAAAKANSEESATEHWIAVAAHHLVKTVKSEHVPEEMAKAFSPELAEQVEITSG